MKPSSRAAQGIERSTLTRRTQSHSSLHTRNEDLVQQIHSSSHTQLEDLHQQNRDWNSLIVNAVNRGALEHALSLYQCSHEEIFSLPNSYTIVALLKACSKLKDLKTGQHIHDHLHRHRTLDANPYIGNTLVNMYAKCGSLAKAQAVFDNMTNRDVILWTSLISAYTEHGQGEDAIGYFKQMQDEGVVPDAFTFVAVLRAVGSMKAGTKGQEIHGAIMHKAFENDLYVGTALVDMYTECHLFEEAQEVVSSHPVGDVVLWSALISGYVEKGLGQGALDCFREMQLAGFSPSLVILICMCKACGSIRSTCTGQMVHHEATMRGFEGDIILGSTLVDMYAKSGLLREAQHVFDKLSSVDVVSWTALILGYAEHGYGEAALECYEQMRGTGISSDPITLVCSLKACGSIGATGMGHELHAEIFKKGWEGHILASSTLLDMYTKCCSLKDAEDVFNKLPNQDVIAWTALITGYAQIGQSEMVFNTIDRMTSKGMKPDHVTFSSLLNVCSQSGLVDDGKMYFETFTRDYCLVPRFEHYNCMVDLFCRAGHIEKAIRMIKRIPFHPQVEVWHTVLGACRKWKNVDLARHAFKQAVRLDETDISAYICMSNIFADASMLEEASKVCAMMAAVQVHENSNRT